MKEEIKKILVDYCNENGWSTTDQDLKEILVERHFVHEERISKHRWYDLMFVVVNINGWLIGFNWYNITGDNTASDMGLELDFKTVCLVEKKQKTVDYYEKIKD